MGFRQQAIAQAMAHLHRMDRQFSPLIHRIGPFTLKVHRDRYDLLVRSILSQQISTKAARAIRLKLEARLNHAGITPAGVLSLNDTALREVGLSAQKVKYLRDLSERVESGRLVLNQLGRQPDEEVIARLTEVHGIGRWTAQMFLIFALARMDIFPDGDLGLRAALREIYGLAAVPTPGQSRELAKHWSPYATIATWYAWRVSDLKSDPAMSATEYPV